MGDPHTSQVRIGRAGAADKTIGCGLLVTSRHVITCAHVVAQALGIEESTATAPADSIPIDLPLLAHPFHTTGRVIHWLPVREPEDKVPEDIAVLELASEPPPQAEPAPILGLAPDDYTDLEVHCFGFPVGIDEGVRRPGTCRGENTRGWVQLDVERGLVGGGFSGTGAWDPKRSAAVGLVVAARTAEQSAALIPTRTLVSAWPELGKGAPGMPNWPIQPPLLQWPMADHSAARTAFERLVTCTAPWRSLMLRGPSETGKTHITRQMLRNALQTSDLACGRFDFKGTTNMDPEMRSFGQYLDVPLPPPGPPLVERLDQVLDALKHRAQPALMIFDTYEAAGEAQDWVTNVLFPNLIRENYLRIVVAGQQVPEHIGAIYEEEVSLITLTPPPPEDWLRFAQMHKSGIDLAFVRKAYKYCGGKASVLAALLGPER